MIIEDVDEFVSSFQHYTTCLPVDPLQWMGAVRMRVQTAYKTSQLINIIINK